VKSIWVNIPEPGGIVAPVRENPKTVVEETLTVKPSGAVALINSIPYNSNLKPPTFPLK
jgi:hypothetical protein